jgi:phospholipid/cholesterol/gamma-HCH transport system substrate-binding protein
LVSKNELRGLVHDLRPAVPSLTKLNVASVPLYQQVRAASSCQNNVILPWSHQTLQDSQFPATGPVYQEQPKVLPGLGADSREFDANAIWFRILVGSSASAFPSGNGTVTFGPQPIVGVNPVKPAAQPSYRSDVPCETQAPPNLASTPGGAPPGQMNTALPKTSAGVRLQTRLEATTVHWLRDLIKKEGLTHYLRVSTTPITPAEIPHLKQLGSHFLGGQR